MNHQGLPFRGALISSTVMAFAGLGDAFLYPFLPIYGKDLGFSVLMIGALLSVNRFARILANTQIANSILKLGMKKVLMFCSALAVITTFVYGFNGGFFVFLIARVLWGLSYSGLKIATLNYAAQVENKAGLAFGISQSIKSLGGLFILWFGPVLVQNLGISYGIFIIGLISTIGLFLTFQLPEIENSKQAVKVKSKHTCTLSPINLLVFMLSISIDGILVVTLAQLIGSSIQDNVQLLAVIAFYILLKKFFAFTNSFIGGVLTLLVKPFTIYTVSILLSILSLYLIAFNYTVTGIMLAFLFNSLVVTFSPLIAMRKENNDSLQAISSTSTWWDLGAGVGAFSGIYLMEIFGSTTLFIALATLTLVLYLIFLNRNGSTYKRFI